MCCLECLALTMARQSQFRLVSYSDDLTILCRFEKLLDIATRNVLRLKNIQRVQESMKMCVFTCMTASYLSDYVEL